jgi:WXG100 protein secretion system (Wss), protein YukD
VSETSLCRVVVHVDGFQLDVSLPVTVPIGALIPQLCDLAMSHGAPALSMPMARQLSLPGLAPCDLAKTLGEIGICDGSILIITTDQVPPPVVRHHDDGSALASAAGSGPRWTADWSRTAALLTTVVMAALTGFLVVPGPSSVPRLLLACASAVAVSAAAALLGSSGTTPMTVVATVGGLVTAITLTATVFGISPGNAGVGLAVSAVVLLSVAGRISIVIAGVSPARQAHQVLARLECAAAFAAASGVFAAVLGAERTGWPLAGFIAAVTTGLLLRSWTHPHPVTRSVLIAAGICCGTALLLNMEHGELLPPISLAAAAVVAAATSMWLGFRSPVLMAPPTLHRCVAAAEFAALAVAVPLAAWAVGLYHAARGIGA